MRPRNVLRLLGGGTPRCARAIGLVVRHGQRAQTTTYRSTDAACCAQRARKLKGGDPWWGCGIPYAGIMTRRVPTAALVAVTIIAIVNIVACLAAWATHATALLEVTSLVAAALLLAVSLAARRLHTARIGAVGLSNRNS
ncbi:hypothetical protein GCM10027047_39190 [Rhodococcus aerolatus]